MTNGTAISPPGVFLLASIREIFELAGVAGAIDSGLLKPKLLEFSPQEYKEKNKSVPLSPPDGHPGFDMSLRKALANHMCPSMSVAAQNGVRSHAMCAYKIQHGYIIMKNSDHKNGWMEIPITQQKDFERCNEALYIQFKLKR